MKERERKRERMREKEGENEREDEGEKEGVDEGENEGENEGEKEGESSCQQQQRAVQLPALFSRLAKHRYSKIMTTGENNCILSVYLKH